MSWSTWSNERGGFPLIIGIILLILIIFIGILLMNTMNGAVQSASCGEQYDACDRNCGADINCKQECKRDYDSCISRRPVSMRRLPASGTC
jgi:hypothetical protein